MMFGYDNLVNWYKTNFNLMQHHKYSLSDIEGMIPWERHLYVDLLKEFISAENERIREENIARQRQRR